MSFKALSEGEAEQFAVMLLAGVPPSTAVKYFFDEETTPEELNQAARMWPQNEKVSKAFSKLEGKNWMKMSPEERIEAALKKHYNEMAFYLYSNSYADLDDKKVLKADKCRDVLEKKLAGAAGTGDPLIKLYQDILAGKVKTGNNVIPITLTQQ